MRRFLIASGTSLLVCLVLFVCSYFGVLPLQAAVRGTVGIVALIVLFYVLFRFGLNLRFADPSLTAEQICVAIVFLAYFMYYTEPVRGELSLFYLVALLFGVLRLDTRQLLFLAGFALVAHGAMLGLWHASQPGANLVRSATQFAVLLIVLPWFAVMSGYVNSLRHRLSDSNRAACARRTRRIEQIAHARRADRRLQPALPHRRRWSARARARSGSARRSRLPARHRPLQAHQRPVGARGGRRGAQAFRGGRHRRDCAASMSSGATAARNSC